VRDEVRRYNEERGDVFQGLIQPTDTEARLNGYRMRKRRRIRPELQVDKAIEAFGANGFFPPPRRSGSTDQGHEHPRAAALRRNPNLFVTRRGPASLGR